MAPISRRKALELASMWGLDLIWMSADLRADFDIVKAAVSNDGHALEFASEDLKANHEIVKTAVSHKGWTLRFASIDLKANREIVKIAVSNHGEALRYASIDLRADYEMVKIAVANEGSALEYASEDLKADPEIVKIAVSGYSPRALQNASNNLKADPGIVKIAVSIGEALEFASRNLKADREIVGIAVSQDGNALRFASGTLQNDPVLVALAIVHICIGRRVQGGDEIIGRLRRLQMDLEQFHPYAVFCNEESVEQQARSWRDSSWQKIYPIWFASFWNISGGCAFSFRLANELGQLAPVVGAFAKYLGTQWRDLEPWLVHQQQ